MSLFYVNKAIHPCKYTVSAYSKVGHTSSWNFTRNLPAKSLKHFAGFLANRKSINFPISTFLTHKCTRKASRDYIAAEKILYFFGELWLCSRQKLGNRRVFFTLILRFTPMCALYFM